MKKFQVIENLLNLRDENGIQDLTLRTNRISAKILLHNFPPPPA